MTTREVQNLQAGLTRSQIDDIVKGISTRAEKQREESEMKSKKEKKKEKKCADVKSKEKKEKSKEKKRKREEQNPPAVVENAGVQSKEKKEKIKEKKRKREEQNPPAVVENAGLKEKKEKKKSKKKSKKMRKHKKTKELVAHPSDQETPMDEGGSSAEEPEPGPSTQPEPEQPGSSTQPEPTPMDEGGSSAEEPEPGPSTQPEPTPMDEGGPSAEEELEEPGPSTQPEPEEPGPSSQPGPIRRKDRGKSLIPKSVIAKQRKKKEEQTMVKVAIRRSLMDHQGSKYKALAEPSDVESSTSESESEEDMGDDCFDPEREINDPEFVECDVDPEMFEEHDDDVNVEDDDDEVEKKDGAKVQPKATKKKRAPRKKPEPAADNDPQEARPNSRENRDRHKWTDSLKRVATHPFSGPTPSGPRFARLARPVDYFYQFFPLFLFTFISKMTNINLKSRNLVESTTAEMKAYFGIRIIMGLVHVNNLNDYWSDRPGFRNDLISKTMTRRRFDELSANLACSDPGNDPTDMPSTTKEERAAKFKYIRSHPLFHLQRIWDTVLEQCRTKYNCLRELSIDEAMIPYRGFKAWARKFYMPCKPTRHGFKVYALAESATGYFANFFVHCRTAKPQKYVDIAMKVASTHLDRFHHIFTDKLYTHIDLATNLLQRNTYLTGAIKTNSANLPVSFSFSAKTNRTNLKAMTEIKQTPRGTFYSRQRGQLTYSLWNDSSLLPILSSAHSGFRNKKTDFVKRNYSTEGNALASPQQVPAPPAVIDYCKHMGGVDLGDQLRSYHQIHRKASVWWKQILYFLVDLSRVNAYICYKHHRSAQPQDDQEDQPSTSKGNANDDHGDHADDPHMMTHTYFTMAIAEDLIQGYSHGTARRQSAATPVSLENFNGLHILHHMGTKWPKICKLCSMEKKKTDKGCPIKTAYGCPACGVHLCQTFCFPR